MSKAWSMVRLGEVLTPIRRAESVDAHKIYSILGAHWYAEGLYTKDTKLGTQIQANKLYRVEEGDFVYNRLFAWKGSFAIATSENHGCYVSNEFPCFKIKEARLDGSYLWKYFSRACAWANALSLSSGGTPTSRNRLKEEKLLAMQIPLPPLSEQKRIVARIESLAAKIKEAKRLRREAREGGDSLFDRTSECIFQSPELNPYLTHLAKADVQLNREYRDPRYNSASDVFLYVDISSVNSRTGVLKSAQECSIHKAPSRARRVVYEDDIIFSTVRPNLRAIAKIADELNNQICSTGFAVFSCGPNIEPDFLYHQLYSPFFIKQCVEKTTGGHYPAINDTNLKKLLVSVPPKYIQINIIQYLNRLKVKVDALKRFQEETGAALEAILPAVLDKAFQGEL